MNRKIWIGVSIAAGVLVLAAASYVAILLVTTGSISGLVGSVPQQGRGYQVIQPTEVPQRLPDMVGPVVAVTDKSFTVQSNSKGAVDQNGPRTEIVIAADTRVYQDITSSKTSPVVDGKLQMRVTPYTYNQIKIGDLLSAWGSQRGDRLVAEAVIVEVRSATPTP